MGTQQDIASFIETGRKPGRSSLVGMKLLHQRPVRLSDVIFARSRLKTQDLISFLLGYRPAAPSSVFTGLRLTGPRVDVRIRCLSPSGKPAVQIRL